MQAHHTSSQNKWGLSEPMKNSESSEGDQGTRHIPSKEAGATVHSQREPSAKMSKQWSCPGSGREECLRGRPAPRHGEAVLSAWPRSLGPFSVAEEGSVGDEGAGATQAGGGGSKGKVRAETSLASRYL